MSGNGLIRQPVRSTVYILQIFIRSCAISEVPRMLSRHAEQTTYLVQERPERLLLDTFLFRPHQDAIAAEFLRMESR